MCCILTKEKPLHFKILVNLCLYNFALVNLFYVFVILEVSRELNRNKTAKKPSRVLCRDFTL